jgi:hypothetical protein
VEAQDEAGNTYYYDEVSGVSKWERPEAYTPPLALTVAPGVDAEWAECQDDHGQTYYYNQALGLTQWEKPGGSELVSYQGAGAVTAFGASDWQECQDDQGQTYFYNTVSGRTQWEKPEPLDATGAWEELQSEEGRYYYNSTTGESRWDPPPDLPQDGALVLAGATTDR